MSGIFNTTPAEIGKNLVGELEKGDPVGNCSGVVSEVKTTTVVFDARPEPEVCDHCDLRFDCPVSKAERK